MTRHSNLTHFEFPSVSVISSFVVPIRQAPWLSLMLKPSANRVHRPLRGRSPPLVPYLPSDPDFFLFISSAPFLDQAHVKLMNPGRIYSVAESLSQFNMPNAVSFAHSNLGQLLKFFFGRKFILRRIKQSKL